MKIAIATCAKVPELYGPEQALPATFRELGVTAELKLWDAPEVRWQDYDAVVIRATWDYVEHYARFRSWLEGLESAGRRVINSARLVLWNLDKRYLRELEGKGVLIPPTLWVEQGERRSLAELVAEKGWERFVLKPAVSAGAHQTYRLSSGEAAGSQGLLDGITAGSTALIQPYFHEIESEGELSLHFFGNELSHAIVKVPAPKDFRVQFIYGGTFRRIEPDAALLADARKVLDRLPERPAYARVDGVRRDGRFHLMECELIEPYLHFEAAPEAALRYARAIVASLPGSGKR